MEEETHKIEKWGRISRNLQGPAKKVFKEGSARISVTNEIIRRRALATPGEEAQDNIRLELAALRKDETMKADFKKARAEIARLKTQAALALTGSPKRIFKGDKNRVRST